MTVQVVAPPTLHDIRAARERIADAIVRTPLVRLNIDDGPAEIWLKLENLQPIGSFKLRGAGNAMRLAGKDRLQDGVVTASAGNMAQGVAWNARQMDVPCTVIVPDHAPATKLAAIERLGGQIVKAPFEAWWNAIIEHRFPGVDGLFIHPVSDSAVIAGNATIGLEIVEDLPDVEAVLIPYGGGGLSSGIGTAVKALVPGAKVYACEVETAAPLKPSLDAGHPQAVEYKPSFVDGIGGNTVLDEMWPLVQSVIDDSIVMPLDAVARALKLVLERNHLIAEGAAATAIAAALSGRAGSGRIVCVVSGGNIDWATLVEVVGSVA
ncbi:MAG: pyridoxal-phosphate dependent enzyme [Gemmatimonadetes bacterium]|nr:pyridoxal-phosphate dependent enzyme [Gemmatimonadota bacterium]